MSQRRDRHWDKLPIPLSWILQLDECASPNVLRDALGDGYLYQHSPLFRRIRDVVIESGYLYCSGDTPLRRHYLTAPLLALRWILEQRTIPYFDTKTTMATLLAEQPHLAFPAGSLCTIVRPNRAYHESAHALAHELLRPMAKELGSTVSTEGQLSVLLTLCEESFANAVERLGTSLNYRQVPDILFYNLSSYMQKTDSVGKLTAIMDHADARRTFRLLYFAFFEANCSGTKPDEAVRARIESAAECGTEDAETAAVATDEGFALSNRFRENMTPNYFRLLGCEKDYAAFASSAWLGKAAHAELARAAADALFDNAAAWAWKKAE